MPVFYSILQQNSTWKTLSAVNYSETIQGQCVSNNVYCMLVHRNGCKTL